MINVAGRKFLVIPHPVIESPPPSPPLTNQNQASSSSNNQTSKNSKYTKNEKLGVLLKPADSDCKMPCFDVEMTPDGQYILLPKTSSKKNVFKNKQAEIQTWFSGIEMVINI